jgi:hypothetical protein
VCTVKLKVVGEGSCPISRHCHGVPEGTEENDIQNLVRSVRFSNRDSNEVLASAT